MTKLSFVDSSFHPNSQHLLINRCEDQKLYYQKRREYNFSGRQIQLSDDKVYTLNPIRFDFGRYQNINVGWKIHLNVSLENIMEASDFLIKHGFLHKYFTGGSLEDGKVSTVYFGSWEKMYDQTKFIESNIGHLLAKPKAQGEIEIKAGITARFTVLRDKNINIWGEENYSDDVYSQHGNFGICMKKETAQKIAKNKGKSVFNSKEEEIRYYEKIFNELVEEFKEYFVDLDVASFR